MYSRQSRPCIARTTLSQSLARGGTARVAALLSMILLAVPSICLCATSSDLVASSNSLFQDGTVSIGYLRNGAFVEYNTPFDVCPNVIGWCLDKSPGPEGMAILNTSDQPVLFNHTVWQPGILYLSPGLDDQPVAVRFKPSKSQAVNCTASFAVKPGSGELASVRVSKNTTAVKSETVDSTQKQGSTAMSSVLSVVPADSVYFVISNVENEICGWVGVQLFVTPDAAKVDASKSIKPAFVSNK